jgi:ABC-type uncharacterized transport system auxiliary subunit
MFFLWISRPTGGLPVLVSALAAFASGCALTSKSDVNTVHYYEPDSFSARKTEPKERGTVEVRLGRISGATHLRERRVVRMSTAEISLDDEHRWTERPDVYLRRALARQLFDEMGLRQSVSGLAPVLDAELVKFEEVVRDGKRVAVRVGVVYALHDEHSVLGGETFEVESAIADPLAEGAIVAAYGKALREVVERIGNTVASSASRSTNTVK